MILDLKMDCIFYTQELKILNSLDITVVDFHFPISNEAYLDALETKLKNDRRYRTFLVKSFYLLYNNCQ